MRKRKRPMDEFAAAQHPSPLYEQTFVNSRYEASLRSLGEVPPFGDCIEMTLKRRDKKAIMDWRDVQLIKAQLFAPEREMIQIFPAESRHVDTANQYYFYILGRGYSLPFGFRERLLLSPEVIPSKGKQRPFAPEHQAPDLDARADEVREPALQMIDALEKAQDEAENHVDG